MKYNTHTILNNIIVMNNELTINNRPITEIVEIMGSTPFYVYDKSLIIKRLKMVREIFPKELKINYAIKANPMPAVVHAISPYVDGFDLASHKEMLIALSTKIQPKNISIAGPGKSIVELNAAIAAGIIINVESASEMKKIVNICSKKNKKANVSLRINPSFSVKGSGMVMGGASTQFGIDVDQVYKVLKLRNERVSVNGLHIYCGSQNLNNKSICEIFDSTFHLAKTIIEEYKLDLDHLNMGGGLGVPYFLKDQPINLKVISESLEKNIKNWHQLFPKIKVIMELGRFLVAESGVYICKVIEKKTSKGQTYLVTDGGLNHHLAATGNFGQIIRRNYPISIANNIQSDQMEEASIVGPLCTPLDVLGRKVLLPISNSGDLVAIHQSGAYGLTASPINFLSQPLPGEILL